MLWSDLFEVFGKALLPPLLYCTVGAVADRCLQFDLRTLSRLMIYVCVPALLFSNLMQVSVRLTEVVQVAAFTALILLAMAGLGWVYARLLRLDEGTSSGAILSVTFFNAVNLGFPVVLFAFGDEGLQLAGVLVAVNSIPHNGFGLFIAARGRLSRGQALRALLRMPLIYTPLLAVLLRWTGVAVPEILFQPIQALGQAAIPLILVLVGMELGRLRPVSVSPQVGGAVALRLLLGPLIAWWAAELVGLSGLLRSIVILQASMPTAVMPIVYARQFGGNVDFVSRTVFVSTLASLLTLPVLLSLLR